MKQVWATWTVLLLSLLLIPASALASIGVGVGTGKIEVNEKLKAGGIYTLPPITVFNVGTEPATYTVAVTLNEEQPQLKPDPKWFSFSPAQFTLEPHQSQIVTPTLRPPIRTQPGNYFAYLEAHPAETAQQGTTTIGVAAATKLSFTLAPSGLFFGLLYRLLGLYRFYEPWTQIAAALIVLAIVLLIINRFVNLKKAWRAGRSSDNYRSRKRY